jgi:hypothetical protein
VNDRRAIARQRKREIGWIWIWLPVRLVMAQSVSKRVATGN